jgi:RNase H-fold protein (predicted Holliday junction resolvase)
VSPLLLAVDPGRQKVGIALLSLEGEVQRRSVVNFLSLETDLISFLGEDRRRLEVVVVGNGTHVGPVRRRLLGVLGEDLEVVEIDETESTLEARQLFYQEFPPGFFLGLLPRGLWPEPDMPLDGFAAEVLGRRFLDAERAVDRLVEDPGTARRKS